MLISMSNKRMEQLLRERHPFIKEHENLLRCGGLEAIDKWKEAGSRFKIFEDMVESYIYLNKGKFQASLVKSHKL